MQFLGSDELQSDLIDGFKSTCNGLFLQGMIWVVAKGDHRVVRSTTSLILDAGAISMRILQRCFLEARLAVVETMGGPFNCLAGSESTSIKV